MVNNIQDVKPGAYFSLFIEVRKEFANSFPGNEGRLKIPNEWSILSEKKILKETGVRYMYTISTSKESASKIHYLDFGLFVKDKIIAFESIGVNISESYQLEVVTLGKTPFILEGDTLETSFLIQNLGNSPETVKLSTNSGKLDVDSLIIKPSTSKVVKLFQIVPITTQSSWQISSDITLNVEGRKPIYQVTSVPVYTDREKKLDNDLRIPIEVGVNHLNYKLGNTSVNAFQFNAQGRGYLDFKEKHYIDFLANGPNNSSLPNLGNYDQYSLNYIYKGNTSVVVGDYTNKVSNLLEFGRAGRGVKLSHKINDNNVSFFYQNARFAVNQKFSVGATYEMPLKNENKVKFSYISKKFQESSGKYMSTLVSSSGYFNWKNLEVDAELSFGMAKKKLGMAIYGELDYSIGKLKLHSQVIKAGKDFKGFYTNSDFLMNSVNYRVNDKIVLGVNSSFSRINPSLDIIRYAVSPLSKSNSAFFSYRISNKHSLMFNYTRQEREDRMEPASYHYKESFGNVSYSYYSERLELNAQTRFGKSSNLLVSDKQENRGSYAATLQPLVSVTPWLKIGAYAEYQHTNKFSADNSSQNLFYYGGSVSMNYREFISLNFMYRNNYAPDEFFEKRNFTNASLAFNFKNQSLALVGGRSFSPSLASSGQNSSFFSIKYTIKLNPRLAKNKNIGHMGGKLVGVSEGIPKKGIMVKLGPYKTLTDSTGSFHFNNIYPDKYLFTIPPSFELSGIKSLEKTPLEVDIVSDSTSYVEIPLVKTGGVAGVLNIRATDKYDYTKEGKSRPVVLAKLTNGKETLVTAITKNNEYSFKEVKPGEWLLKVYIPGNQEEYEILNSESHVYVESSKVELVNFTLRTIKRKIQNTGQQFHLSSNK